MKSRILGASTIFRRLRGLHLATLIVAGAGAEICRATAITVTSLTDALSINGQITLRGAIQTADSTSGDTIQFAPGLFASGPATLSMAGTEFPITSSMTITGPGQNLLTLDAQQFSRIFNINNSSAIVTIGGMTLTNGIANNAGGPGGSGGGITSNATLTLQNATVSNCKAGNNFIETDTVIYGGGGIYNLKGNLSVQNCTFKNNSCNVTGGGILSSTGTLNVSGSKFTGNTALSGNTGDGNNGDSIAAAFGATLVMDSTTADNPVDTIYFNTTPRAHTTITNSALGRVSTYGTTTISNSTMGNLDAYESTAISNSTIGAITESSYEVNGNLNVTKSTLAQVNQQFGNATITNSTFKSAGPGNYALSVGAGLGTTFLENDTIGGYQSSGNGTVYIPVGPNATIRNSTIAGNQAARGGGVFVASGNLNMDSTIVADNTATTIANDYSGYISGQNNLIGDPTGAFLLNSNNLTGVNPLLAPLSDNGGPTYTKALLAGSPAIDAGSNIDNLAFDQRGFARVTGLGPDIGAYESPVPEPSALCLLSMVLPMTFHRRSRRRSGQWSPRGSGSNFAMR